MSEWWSYTLSDFLLFSPRTYYRLYERTNADLWPIAVLAIGLGLILAGLLRRETPRRWPLILGSLSVLWMFIALVFHGKLFQSINWAAQYFAWAFMLESVLLLWFGVIRWKGAVDPVRGVVRFAGLALVLFSLVFYPAVAVLAGRPLRQAELFGLAPDPTVIGTMGFLLVAGGGRRWILLPIPLFWCLISGLTLFAMGSPEVWILALAGLVTTTACRVQQKKRAGCRVKQKAE